MPTSNLNFACCIAVGQVNKYHTHTNTLLLTFEIDGVQHDGAAHLDEAVQHAQLPVAAPRVQHRQVDGVVAHDLRVLDGGRLGLSDADGQFVMLAHDGEVERCLHIAVGVGRGRDGFILKFYIMLNFLTLLVGRFSGDYRKREKEKERKRKERKRKKEKKKKRKRERERKIRFSFSFSFRFTFSLFYFLNKTQMFRTN